MRLAACVLLISLSVATAEERSALDEEAAELAATLTELAAASGCSLELEADEFVDCVTARAADSGGAEGQPVLLTEPASASPYQEAGCPKRGKAGAVECLFLDESKGLLGWLIVVWLLGGVAFVVLAPVWYAASRYFFPCNDGPVPLLSAKDVDGDE